MKYAILNEEKTQCLYLTNNLQYKNYVLFEKVNSDLINKLINKDKEVIKFKKEIELCKNIDYEQKKEIEKELLRYIQKEYKTKYYLIENNKIIEKCKQEERKLRDNIILYDAENILIKEYELNILRNEKKQEVDKIKNELENMIEFEGNKFQIDNRGQLSFIETRKLFENNEIENIDWVSYDNKLITLSKSKFLELCSSIVKQLKNIRINRIILKNEIDVLTKEEIENINIKERLVLYI